MKKIIIEKNIPLPPKINREVYPFRKMEIGDSFLVEIINTQNIYNQKQRIMIAKWRFCQRNESKKFKTLSVKEGLRVWRVE